MIPGSSGYWPNSFPQSCRIKILFSWWLSTGGCPFFFSRGLSLVFAHSPLHVRTSNFKTNPSHTAHCFCLLFYSSGASLSLWSRPWHMEASVAGIKPVLQQQPELLQWQCLILNSWNHMGTPAVSLWLALLASFSTFCSGLIRSFLIISLF